MDFLQALGNTLLRDVLVNPTGLPCWQSDHCAVLSVSTHRRWETLALLGSTRLSAIPFWSALSWSRGAPAGPVGPVPASTARWGCQGKGEVGDSHCSPMGEHSPSVWHCSSTYQARKGVRIWLFISCYVIDLGLGIHIAGNHHLCWPQDIGILSGQFLAFRVTPNLERFTSIFLNLVNALQNWRPLQFSWMSCHGEQKERQHIANQR